MKEWLLTVCKESCPALLSNNLELSNQLLLHPHAVGTQQMEIPCSGPFSILSLREGQRLLGQERDRELTHLLPPELQDALPPVEIVILHLLIESFLGKPYHRQVRILGIFIIYLLLFFRTPRVNPWQLQSEKKGQQGPGQSPLPRPPQHDTGGASVCSPSPGTARSLLCWSCPCACLLAAGCSFRAASAGTACSGPLWSGLLHSRWSTPCLVHVGRTGDGRKGGKEQVWWGTGHAHFLLLSQRLQGLEETPASDWSPGAVGSRWSLHPSVCTETQKDEWRSKACGCSQSPIAQEEAAISREQEVNRGGLALLSSKVFYCTSPQ